MKNSIKTLSVILISLFISNSMLAQPFGGPDCHKGVKGHKGEMSFLPDLTDKQKEEMKTLRTAHMKEMLPLKNELNEERAKLQTLTTAEKVDMNAVNAQIDKMSAIKTKLAKKRQAHKQSIRNILTDEQRVIFDSHSGKGGNGKKGHGMHGNGGQGCRGNCK